MTHSSRPGWTARTPQLPDTLELRIHGIKNTPPSEVLGLPESDIVLDRGDDLGGFWREKAPAPGAPTRREAYSWGAMARSNGGSLAGVGQLFVHIGWLLLLPFGLTNAAYWMRAIPQQDWPGAESPEERARRLRTGVPAEWAGGPGSSLVRLFALGMTLLYVVVLATVSIELVGVQCYRSGEACSGLPDILRMLADLPRAGRLAVFAIVPLIGVVLLALIGQRARARYEASIVALEREQTRDVGPVHVLATNGFWRRARVAAGTERLHFAAAITVLAAMLAWDHLMVPYRACRTPLSAFPGDCLVIEDGAFWRGVTTSPATAILFACTLALLGAIVVIVVPGSFRWARRARRLLSLPLLAGAAILAAGIVAATLAESQGRPPVSSPFLGLVATPVNLVGGLTVLALAGLAIRRVRMRAIWFVVVLSFVLPCVRYLLPEGAGGLEWVFPVISAALVVLQVGMAILPRSPAYDSLGWSGRGPGVVMLLAVGTALAMSSVLVVGVAAWLSPPRTGSATDLVVPSIYATFGVGVLLALAVLGIGLAALAVRHLAATTLGTEASVHRQTRSKRRLASLAHRAEPVLGWLAIGFGLALLAAAVPELTAGDGRMSALFGPQTLVDRLVRDAPEAALVILGLIAAALVVGIANNALTTKERPLGLLWDLLCFLPRAGHPFGPPCYSERVVPEVDARIRDWLQPEGVDETVAASRRVVLSAHSLGAVLAVSSIFALRTQDPSLVNRVGLLTYGTQLRPYFGRFFPELFGPAVLGTEPCPAPSLWATEPWPAERSAVARMRAALVAARRRPRVAPETGRGGPGASLPGDTRRGSTGDDSLTRILASVAETASPTRPRGPGSRRPGESEVAWVSLYRPTDFLGFPVANAAGAVNGIDLLATEEDGRTYLPTVATHGHYPSAPEYETALREVMDRIPRRSARAGPAAGSAAGSAGLAGATPRPPGSGRPESQGDEQGLERHPDPSRRVGLETERVDPVHQLRDVARVHREQEGGDQPADERTVPPREEQPATEGEFHEARGDDDEVLVER